MRSPWAANKHIWTWSSLPKVVATEAHRWHSGISHPFPASASLYYHRACCAEGIAFSRKTTPGFKFYPVLKFIANRFLKSAHQRSQINTPSILDVPLFEGVFFDPTVFHTSQYFLRFIPNRRLGCKTRHNSHTYTLIHSACFPDAEPRLFR